MKVIVCLELKARIQTNLLDCGVWRIGDGKTVKAWEEPWVDRGICIKDFNIQIPISLSDAVVCDLVGEDGD